MALDPGHLDDAALRFLAESHLATLTLVRPDGSPHVTPVGFSYDADARLARIISFAGSQKYRYSSRPGGVPAALSQLDGGRWLTLEGTATAVTDPSRVAAAVMGYGTRYSQPGEREDRVAIEIAVSRILGRG
jgi:PPOX class probable F420-dependent enzyme